MPVWAWLIIAGAVVTLIVGLVATLYQAGKSVGDANARSEADKAKVAEAEKRVEVVVNRPRTVSAAANRLFNRAKDKPR